MSNGMKTFLIAVVVAVFAAGTVVYLTTPEDRTLGEKISDAGDSLDNGVDDAARQLEDRSPAEKIQDGIDDASDGN